MANKKLEEFVIRLGEDAKLMESYVENPIAVMRGAGLDEKEITAVLEGDQKAIKKMIGDHANCINIIMMMKK